MERSERKSLSNAFGDALSRAFELVLTPLIFGALGFLLDRALGVLPLFTLVLSLSVISYELWKLWHDYSLTMDRHEQELLGRPEKTPDQRVG